jgi:hypothetical protein
MLELSRLPLEIPEMMRQASEDPLIPNSKNRKAGAAIVLILATALFIISYLWFDKEGAAYHNSTYDNCITYTLLSYIIMAGVINERMDTKLKFTRRIRVKNVIKFLCLAAVIFGGSMYEIARTNHVHWSSITIRIALVMMCLLTHTSLASNHYNIVDLIDQSLQRSSISVKNSVIDLRSKHKVQVSELETVIMNYKMLIEIRNWLTIRFVIDICTVFVLYISLVKYSSTIAAIERDYTVLIFGFFLMVQSTSMYTVGQFNKHILSLEHLHNVNTRLVVRIFKWKPSEEVFMSSVVSIFVILTNVIFRDNSSS